MEVDFEFLLNVTFLYPLKTSGNHRFSDVFRGYRNVAYVQVNFICYWIWHLTPRLAIYEVVHSLVVTILDWWSRFAHPGLTENLSANGKLEYFGYRTVFICFSLFYLKCFWISMTHLNFMNFDRLPYAILEDGALN